VKAPASVMTPEMILVGDSRLGEWKGKYTVVCRKRFANEPSSASLEPYSSGWCIGPLQSKIKA